MYTKTVKSFMEMLAASGMISPDEVAREHINKRVGEDKILKYSELYPEIESGSLLQDPVRKFNLTSVRYTGKVLRQEHFITGKLILRFFPVADRL